MQSEIALLSMKQWRNESCFFMVRSQKPFFLFPCLIALIASRMRSKEESREEENAPRQMNALFLPSPICLVESRCRRKLPPSVCDRCPRTVRAISRTDHPLSQSTNKHDDMEVHCLLGLVLFEGLIISLGFHFFQFYLSWPAFSE